MTVFLPRFYPYLNRAWRSLYGPVPLDKFAAEIEEVCPAETSFMPGVITEPDIWDGVTAVQHETSESLERLRVAGGDRHHAATLRYHLRDVLAMPLAHYARGKSVFQKGLPALKDLLRSPIAEHAKGFSPLSPMSRDYFGHWLKDSLSGTLLRQDDEALYFPARPSWPHTRAYTDLLDIQEVSHPASYLAHFDELVVAEDIGMNSNRRARLVALRAQIQKTLPAASSSTATGVMIRRGCTGGQRVLVNEGAIADMLAGMGFNICHANDDLATIHAACNNVPCIVTMEGSHWGHSYYTGAKGALHLTLNPTDRFNCQYADFVPTFEQRLATLVVSRVEGGYYADPDRLLRLIDRAQSEMAAGTAAL